ncbi:MAG: UDP-N-acetylmuramoyl-tripeptide--D-alanyl-D-alanine ligase [Leptolyngbyaceae cyanobacterium bins.59]|nr:UDP-N-acetylmuramoyl-tripeptide--D-alanyl-D-alanine ligase [Leptolyngbyaceae cyanobacterium bins.59]
MPLSIKIRKLIQILNARIPGLDGNYQEQTISAITTDTRSLKPGEAFLALRGDKFDGHNFVEQAIEQGATVAIVDASGQGRDGGHFPLLTVDNTLKAYQDIAHWWRCQQKIPIVAVTGSVGKTTTKELIAAVLTTAGSVLKTQANFNNEIGVPKTLLELGSEHNYGVIEMGMRGPGEIALLTQVARPNVAVITNVGVAHIERLGSEQAIANAKCELLAEIPSDSVAVLNYDNPLLRETAPRFWSGRTLTYGLEGGDLHGEILPSGHLRVADLELPLPLPGRHNALNYLAALAVAQVLGVDWSPLQQGLAVTLPTGRSQRYDLRDNIVILDESYNAGPESMTAALHLLAETAGTRHIAVLGTMRELGDRSPEFHRQVGTVVAKLGLDQLLILADPVEAEALARGSAPVPSLTFTTHAALTQYLQTMLQPGDRVLFKASRAVGLERVVEALRSR